MASKKGCSQSLNTAFLQLHNLLGLLTNLEEGTYLRKAGTTYQQYLVLVVIESSDPPVAETIIARGLHRNLNTISMIVDRMEKKGLLVRKWSEVDRRKTEVKLTEEGKAVLSRALKVGAELRQRLGCVFTPKEVEELTTLVTKLGDRTLEELGQDVPPPPVGHAIRQRVIKVYEKGIRHTVD